MFDFAVIGGGIAGLSIAELLQRSGRAVILIEREAQLCAGASAQQQGWFHTGALYAALPDSTYLRQLVGNLDDLLNYYGDFPGMNLRAGRQLVTLRQEGWFQNATNYYAFVPASDPELRLWQRPLWPLAVRLARARLSWFETLDFTRELSPQIGRIVAAANLHRPLAQRSFPYAISAQATWLRSRDRMVRSFELFAELAGSFLGHGGRLLTGVHCHRAGDGIVETTQGVFRARNVVVAAGRGSRELTNHVVSTVSSPLLVVYPALTDVNFIKMSPNMRSTFNHLYHRIGNDGYSLIGNARYLDADLAADVPGLHEEIRAQAAQIFDVDMGGYRSALYFGDKTELLAPHQRRNYQYQIIDEGERVVVLPGKMSLAFSLAVNVCRHFGIDPVARLRQLGDTGGEGLIAPALHLRHFEALRDQPHAARRELLNHRSFAK